MSNDLCVSDEELPELRSILLPPSCHKKVPAGNVLRRSPRKQARDKPVVSTDMPHESITSSTLVLKATSKQQRQSPSKREPSKQALVKQAQPKQATPSVFDDVPILPKQTSWKPLVVSAAATQSATVHRTGLRLTHIDSLLLPLSKMNVSDDISDSNSTGSESKEGANLKSRRRQAGESVMPLTTKAARNVPLGNIRKGRSSNTRFKANKFVLEQASCVEDIVDSDANDEGEEDDTDLSGFIVDDNAELSYHDSTDSSSEKNSEAEKHSRKKTTETRSQRRLVRGRGRFSDTDEEEDRKSDLVNMFQNMQVVAAPREHQRDKHQDLEVIDLVSPERHNSTSGNPDRKQSTCIETNLFKKLNAVKLSPPRNSQRLEVPSKLEASMSSLTLEPNKDTDRYQNDQKVPQTPPTTPPRSPTKLKSPSKLLSPSKKGHMATRNPTRQSMDAFWDLNTINEWNDQFSPKKKPIRSPRKAMKNFNIWSDSEDDGDSTQGYSESSDDLPSPCESPSKPRFIASPIKSPEKVARQNAQEEKRAKAARKKAFEASKDSLAQELFVLLDKNITKGQITRLAASTGGMKIIWSKTLRSTAGRANWKKTRTATSPVKSSSKSAMLLGSMSSLASSGRNESEVVKHFANIELAEKVIDRPERLYDTLSHEFCHLANFMVSGIIDQPHGAQFQKWAAKTTQWLRNESGRPEWENVKITTKHGYVIEHKYLWTCVGRSSLDDGEGGATLGRATADVEDGCGAEYGRHSKSIDTQKHRCGVCKGLLVQVRPKPRATTGSPKKVASPFKRGTRSTTTIIGKEIQKTIKEIEVIDLTD